jgi:hypothetical protein
MGNKNVTVTHIIPKHDPPSPSKSPYRKIMRNLKAKSKSMNNDLANAASDDPMIEDPPAIKAQHHPLSHDPNPAVTDKQAGVAAKQEHMLKNRNAV